MRGFLADRNGSMVVMGAIGIALAAVLASAAVGLMQTRHATGHLQEVADAAALAGAQAGIEQGAFAAGEAARTAAAALAEGAPITVEVTYASGTEARVTARRTGRVGLGGWLGGAAEVMERSAVAQAAGGEPVCLLLLEDRLNWTSLSLGDRSTLVAQDCAAQLNQRHSDDRLIWWSGAPTARLLATAVVADSGPAPSGYEAPPRYRQGLLQDPFAARVVWPVDPPCQHRDFELDAGVARMTPGVYCGWTAIKSDGDVVLAPGVYVIRGAVNITGASRVHGSGVTFVLMPDVEGGHHSDGDFHVTGRAVLSIQAPASGPWRDIAVAVRPAPEPRSAGSLFDQGELRVGGVVYMPGAAYELRDQAKLTVPAGNAGGLVIGSLRLVDAAEVRMGRGIPGLVIPGAARLIR